ncbi:MAG: hypothetical protein K1X57_06505 [Gemmataceae bacterium]|nr:hypothetical protein [Gemmataceae bacterium]
MRMTAWLLLVAGVVAAPEQPAPLKTTLQEFVDRGEVAGVVAVTGRSTGVVQTEAVGLADVAAGRAMAPTRCSALRR